MRTQGLISRLSKIDPQLRLSAPKFQKNFFAYLSIFLYFWEKIKRYHFLYFEYLSKNSPKLNQNYYWLWVYFGLLCGRHVIKKAIWRILEYSRNLFQFFFKTRKTETAKQGRNSWFQISNFEIRQIAFFMTCRPH